MSESMDIHRMKIKSAFHWLARVNKYVCISNVSNIMAMSKCVEVGPDVPGKSKSITLLIPKVNCITVQSVPHIRSAQAEPVHAWVFWIFSSAQVCLRCYLWTADPFQFYPNWSLSHQFFAVALHSQVIGSCSQKGLCFSLAVVDSFICNYLVIRTLALSKMR